MITDLKRERMTARLPVTPCSIEMRESMEEIASEEGVTLAHLQRYAFEFFLSSHVRKTDAKIDFNSHETAEAVAS